MVAADIDDARVLRELSRRFQGTQPMRREKHGQEWVIAGWEDFERRQEYFLRLLDYYHFSKDRLTGKTREEVERIFGPGTRVNPAEHPSALKWNAGRDTFIVYFDKDRATGAFYAMGY
jgi:hypothetical protein